jgi:hypothetical protein
LADHFSTSDYILYVDCDCVFFNFINIKDYFIDNSNIIILKDYWNDVGQAKCWKECLIKLDLLTDYEFMRAVPYIYPRILLPKIREYICQKTELDFINGCLKIYETHKFSEFNIMGSYAYKNNIPGISFVFSKDQTKITFFKQFWSHTPKNELIKQIKLNFNAFL